MSEAASESRRSIGRKIFLIAASFVLPISVLIYLMVVNINSGIEFAVKEKWGNEYQRVLMELLYRVQTHQLQPAAREESARAIDGAMARLRAVERRHGQALEFTPEGLAKRGRSELTPARLEAAWTKARAGDSAAGAALVASLRGMITHAGDTSNLILDPDLDSYYLMDVTLLALPQNLDRLGKVAEFASQPGAHPVRLAVHAALLRESDEDRVRASAETALNEDANFYGASPTLAAAVRPALERYRQASQRFIAMVEGGGATPEARLSAALAAREAAYSLWTVSVNELDRLLDTRIAAYESRRAWCLLLAGLAIAVAAGLACLLMASITGPLAALMEDLGPGATLLSTCVERISAHGQREQPDKEEAGIICEELAAHADSMRKAVAELAAHINGSDAESRRAPVNR